MVLLWILHCIEILLLFVQVLLIHLLLELDVLFVNSVDLLPQVLMLSLESLNDLILVLELLNFLVVHVSLDLDLVSQLNQFLGLQDNLDVVILLGVACWLAFLSLERSLSDLN